jgi:DnaJ domain
MTLDQALQTFAIGEDQLHYLTPEEVKEMYRQLAKQKHPDKTGGNSRQFIELKDAYIMISSIVQQNVGRSMIALDKDEILNRYQQDTTKLYRTITEQFQSISKIRTEVEDLIYEFENKKKELEGELNSAIETLESSYKKTLFQKIFFFLPSMSEKDFWETYHALVNKQTNKYKNLDFELFKQMAIIYGEGLNQISEILDKNL